MNLVEFIVAFQILLYSNELRDTCLLLFLMMTFLVLKSVALQKSEVGNDSVGYNVLHSHGLPTGDYWYWLGVGVLIAYALLFNNLVTLALAYLNRKSESHYPNLYAWNGIINSICNLIAAK